MFGTVKPETLLRARLSQVLLLLGSMGIGISAFQTIPAIGTLDATGRNYLRLIGIVFVVVGVAAEVGIRRIHFPNRLLRVWLPVVAGILGVTAIAVIWWLPRAPSISTVQPASIDRGTGEVTLTIGGQNFGSPSGARFGNGVTVLEEIRKSSRQLAVRVRIEPDAPLGPHDVTVRSPNGRSARCRSRCFVVTFPPPKVLRIEPAILDQGATDQVVAVTGASFSADAKLALGEGVTTAPVTRGSETELSSMVSVAASAVTGKRDVTVTNADGREDICRGCLTVRVPPPKAQTLVPASLKQGAAKTTVAIKGNSFESVPMVSFGAGVTVEDVKRVSREEVSAVVSVDHVATVGARDVVLTSEDGRSTTCTGCWRIDDGAWPCQSRPIRSEPIKGTARLETVPHDARVEPNINPLMGIYEEVSSDTDIWVLVYPHLAEKYYPQTHRPDHGPAVLLSRNQFRTAASFGGGTDERYDVLVVVAKPEASRALHDALAQWAAARDFRGLSRDELPQGLDTKQCITVTGIRSG